MGQYYKPTNLDKKEYLYTHDFKETFTRDDGVKITVGSGLKLMEHSYIGNRVLNMVERLLTPDGSWYKNRLVWAGDYADHEEGYEKTPEGYDRNIYTIMEEEGTKLKPTKRKALKKYRYLTNHSKKCFIDLTKIKEDKDGYKIHPLPLLVAEGNGRGGGDFHDDDSRVGYWARDIISLEDHVLDGYQEMDGQFVK